MAKSFQEKYQNANLDRLDNRDKATNMGGQEGPEETATEQPSVTEDDVQACIIPEQSNNQEKKRVVSEQKTADEAIAAMKQLLLKKNGGKPLSTLKDDEDF